MSRQKSGQCHRLPPSHPLEASLWNQLYFGRHCRGISWRILDQKVGRVWGENRLAKNKGLSPNRLTPCFYLVPPARFERAAPGLGIRCSILLSYGGPKRFLHAKSRPINTVSGRCQYAGTFPPVPTQNSRRISNPRLRGALVENDPGTMSLSSRARSAI